MSSLEQRQKARPADIDDPDFDACIAARQAMTQPCFWTIRNFTKQGGWEPYTRSCWGGHLLRALGYANSSNQWPDSYHEDLERLSKKLGFEIAPHVFEFNDSHSHAQVLAEFDRRLQQWGEHG